MSDQRSSEEIDGKDDGVMSMLAVLRIGEHKGVRSGIKMS